MDNLDDNIIFIYIAGIFKRDCKQVETLFEERLNDETKQYLTNDVKKYIIYNEIPKYFTGIDSWNPTNLKCWNCDRVFNNPPVFIPKTIDSPSTTCLQIVTEGNFCWFNCAYAHILSTIHGTERENKYHMLKYLFKIFCGFNPKSITPSRSKFCQKQYGGSLDENEYCNILEKYKKQDSNKSRNSV
jgi:hypothetical protein